MIVNDQAGEYGANRKLAPALSEAKTTPTRRAHGRAVATARPAPTRSTPIRRWTTPQTVRSKGKRRSGSARWVSLWNRAAIPSTTWKNPVITMVIAARTTPPRTQPAGRPRLVPPLGLRFAAGVAGSPVGTDIRPPRRGRSGARH